MKRIDRKYEVLKTLGEGFGGFVFLTEAEGQKIALKQLKIDQTVLSPEETLENFKQEFSTLKELSHPHILRILDFGFDAEEKFYYFTTEYIEGQDIFQATRGLSPEEIEDLFVQILRALSYLHTHWVYHLDIKPGNILVGKNVEGQRIAKLIDFGLTGFHKQGVLAGSPPYVAPELFLEERRDGRADLYSLGITWYECLLGKNPFRTDEIKKTLDLQRTWIPPPVSTQLPHLPPYMDPILDKLLKKSPSERYHRADQVIRDLNLSGYRHYPLETEATALAYLPGEGQLIGRQAQWQQLLLAFDSVFLSRSEPKACVILSGGIGTGKSRFLKELKYYAQLQQVPILDFSSAAPTGLKSEALLLADDANEETLKLAQQWMRLFSPHSFLLVIASQHFPEKPEMGLRISLSHFERQEISEFVASVLGVMDPPDFLVDEIFSRTEGNPLLVTELLHSLIESHQIFDEKGRWSPSMLKEVGVDFGKLKAPRNLVEYCQSKFLNLPAHAQKILSLLSLSRAPLEQSQFAKLSLEIQKKDWEILQEQGLITIDPAGGEIKLLNPSFREWTPQNTDSKTLASLHQALGNLFREDPHMDAIASFHLGLGTGNSLDRFHSLTRFGESLLLRHRWVEAAQIFEKASALASLTEDQVQSHLRQAGALFRAGHHSEALKLLEEIQTILKREREDPHRWRWVQQTYREMGSIYIKEGRFDWARESLQSARVLLEEHGEDPKEKMILDNLKASLLMREGKLKEAAALSEQTHREWETLPKEMKKEILNNELAIIYLTQGKKEEARKIAKNRAAFCEEIGNSMKLAYSLYTWADSCYALKDFKEAAEIFERCVDLSRELKNEELLFHAFNGLGNIAYFQKEWYRASEYYQNALELAQHHASFDSSVAIAINLAIVLRHQKDYGSAHIYLRHVIDSLEDQVPPSLHQLQFLTQGYLELAKLSSEDDKWVEARDAYRDAVRLVRHHPALGRFRFSALIGLANTAFQVGRIQEGQSLLTELARGPLSKSEREELEETKKLGSP